MASPSLEHVDELEHALGVGALQRPHGIGEERRGRPVRADGGAERHLRDVEPRVLDVAEDALARAREVPHRTDRDRAQDLRRPREQLAHGDAADPALGHGRSDVVLLERARGHLQQHRAHAVPRPASGAPRRRPRGLVVRAVLHRCHGGAAELQHQGRARARLRVLGRERPSMLYDLRRADIRIKWLVTGLLATLGLSYVFGAVMVALYAGFTPQRVAATYAGPEMSMTMPPDTTVVVQRPMAMADF